MVKVNPTGTAPLVYATFLGGNSIDIGNGIAVDASGNAYVTGQTFSAPDSFPATPGLFGPSHSAGTAFDAVRGQGQPRRLGPRLRRLFGR